MQIQKTNNQIQFTSKMTPLDRQDYSNIKRIGEMITAEFGENAGVECINGITNSLPLLKQLGDDTVEFAFVTIQGSLDLYCSKCGISLPIREIKILEILREIATIKEASISEILTEKLVTLAEEYIEEINKMGASKTSKATDPLEMPIERLKRTFDKVFGLGNK